MHFVQGCRNLMASSPSIEHFLTTKLIRGALLVIYLMAIETSHQTLPLPALRERTSDMGH